eukprot:CAMPEP_0204915508 /NCGR_PEP_ID=MMETSP1397-20131031/13495_1 /ASSEMBLY_ACC=CAM_ASM_000891 /TAXON_ID=49980 /ORGANISM="Climacostomum Climacostomum virens, Strain Stock W-24" /LENGTH=89 /DNA_ID=CAMNT_0052087577 /DNA_START=179 /DNA_END=445 /DNA_ORIENTATION=+
MTVTEDGSECFPYVTLAKALDALLLKDGGKIRIASCSGNLEQGPVIVDEPVDIEGNNCSLELYGQISVEAPLILRNLTLLPKLHFTPLF